MIELLMAMAVLNIGVLAVVAAFNSGAVALLRSARVSTAAALADQQMELYRALTYNAIQLDTSSVSTANSDSYYSGDPAWSSTQVIGTCTGVPNECNPERLTQGADKREYRVDTYITTDNVTGGRSVKRVTIVIRDGNSLSKVFAREASNFDLSTGS